MKLFFLIAFGFICFSSFSQTCIIAVKTKRAIYVSADSRISRYSPGFLTDKMVLDTFSGCKLFHSGKFNFATIGLEIDKAHDIGIEVSKSAKSIDDFSNQFIQSFSEELSQHLKSIKAANRMRYSYFTSATPVSQLIVFGVEKHKLILKSINFEADNSLFSALSENVDISYSITKESILFGGHTEEIKDTLFTPDVFKDGIVKTLIYLTNIESDAHPVEVGGDVDIIKISKRKTKWIQRKQMCE